MRESKPNSVFCSDQENVLSFIITPTFSVEKFAGAQEDSKHPTIFSNL